MGKAVLQSELVRVSPGSREEGLQLCSAWSWDLPLHGLAVPGRRMAACCAGMQGGLWALLAPPNTDCLLSIAMLSSPMAVPSVPASPAGVKAVAPSSATTAGSPGTPMALVYQCHPLPAWPALQHS